MTTRIFTSPLVLGFDHIELLLEQATKKSSDGYPPFNIEQTGPASLRITLAVAGFTMEDSQITHEDNQLVIRGRQTDDGQNRVFLHRGIAARQFQRVFVLSEHIEVRGRGWTTGCCMSTWRGRSRRGGCGRFRSAVRQAAGQRGRGRRWWWG
jgi:HSP20 family molecular chaperone IbpA